MLIKNENEKNPSNSIPLFAFLVKVLNMVVRNMQYIRAIPPQYFGISWSKVSLLLNVSLVESISYDSWLRHASLALNSSSGVNSIGNDAGQGRSIKKMLLTL